MERSGDGVDVGMSDGEERWDYRKRRRVEWKGDVAYPARYTRSYEELILVSC